MTSMILPSIISIVILFIGIALGWRLRQCPMARTVVIIATVIAVGSVAYLSTTGAQDPSAAFQEKGNVGQFVDAVGQLETKLEKNPDDHAARLMLAHSYRAMGRYSEAVAAFGKAWDLVKDNPDELTLFAGTLAVWRSSFNDKPDELIAKALNINPQHGDALMLAGGSAFEKHNYPAALTFWQKAAALPNLDPEDHAWIDEHLAEVNAILHPKKNLAQTIENDANDAPTSTTVMPTASDRFVHPPMTQHKWPDLSRFVNPDQLEKN